MLRGVFEEVNWSSWRPVKSERTWGVCKRSVGNCEKLLVTEGISEGWLRSIRKDLWGTVGVLRLSVRRGSLMG